MTITASETLFLNPDAKRLHDTATNFYTWLSKTTCEDNGHFHLLIKALKTAGLPQSEEFSQGFRDRARQCGTSWSLRRGDGDAALARAAQKEATEDMGEEYTKSNPTASTDDREWKEAGAKHLAEECFPSPPRFDWSAIPCSPPLDGSGSPMFEFPMSPL